MNLTNLSIKQFANKILIGSSAILIFLFLFQLFVFKNIQNVQADQESTASSTTASPTPTPTSTSTPIPNTNSTTTTTSSSDLFAGGNFMTAVNNTQRTSDWTDPVSANPGENIEYRIVAQNVQSGTVAHDVTFHVNFPTSPSNSPQVEGVVSANGVSVSDTATVNVNGSAGYLIIYQTGHTRVFSPGCPDGCNADDSFRDGGNINVGDLAFGESAQVLFKAGITNPAPTSTPTPTPTLTPTATPTPPACTSNDNCSVSTPSACGQTNSGVDNCGNTCTRSSAVCTPEQHQEQSQSQTVNITTPTPTPSTPPVTSLPKTGLPEVAWSALALIPAGFSMRRFSKSKKDLQDHPSFIAEERKFKSAS